MREKGGEAAWEGRREGGREGGKEVRRERKTDQIAEFSQHCERGTMSLWRKEPVAP